jgi:RNA polymerase sigma-70 factor (ECF subfamily)
VGRSRLPAIEKKRDDQKGIDAGIVMLEEDTMPTDDSRLTRPSLLLRIRDSDDHVAWEEFVALYAPLVYRFARRRGLQDADASDLCQQVLQVVSQSARRLDYDPSRGSFRGWLLTVTRNILINTLKRKNHQPIATGETSFQQRLDAQPAPQVSDESIWEQEYQRSRLAWAAEKVRPRFEDTTWQAFWLTAVEGERPRDVAQALGLSVGAVHIAKSRVIARLKDVLKETPEE